MVHEADTKEKMSKGLRISESHPLSSELSSLRNAVTRFQDEAYNTSMKLQRHSLQAANAHDRFARLERENDILRSELGVLRAHPHPDTSPQAHPAALQVQQLSLSLRRLSDKLSLTEEALLERTTQLAYATAEASKAKFAAENAYQLASRTRGREETGKTREMELEWKVKAAEEAARMSDLAVAEYADLVRSLDIKSGMRPSLASTTGHPQYSLSEGDPQGSSMLQDRLSEGKLGLQRLLSDFSVTAERSQKELLECQGELAELKARQNAEDKCLELCRSELANSQAELERLRIEDNTAAKMVSRYMKFSQKSTDTLQRALEALKTRHAATVNTISSQMSDLSEQLQLSEQQTEKLRHALDDLGSETLKEAYGRRREVALRIRLVNREERLREGLERWLRRVGETMMREDIESQALRDMIHEAHTLLSGNFDGLTDSSDGSLARLLMAESTVEALKVELEAEMARRLESEKVLHQYNPDEATAGLAKETSTWGPTSFTNSVSENVRPPPLTIEAGKFNASVLPAPIEASQNHLPSPLNQTSPPLCKEEVVGSEEPDTQDTTSYTIASEGRNHRPTDLGDVPHPQVSLPLLETREVLAENPSPVPGDPQTQSSESLVIPISPSDAPKDEHVPDPDPEPTDHVVDKIKVSLDSHPTHDAHIDILSHQKPNQLSSEPTPIPQSTQSPIYTSPSPAPQSTQSPIYTPPSPSSQKSLPHVGPPSPKPVIESLPSHPLLSELPKAKQRYDSLQRSLRDCHLALEALSSELGSTLDSPKIVRPEVIRTALQRLTDYTEDARVEVEIRIADEALLARGYETLLSVPGALLPAGKAPLEDGHDTPNHSDIELQVEEFISGKEPSIEKSYLSLSRKLEDVEHDIAVLKRAVHAEVVGSLTPRTAPTLNGSDSSPPQAGGGWSSWVLNSPSSPAESPSAGLRSATSPPPTFGSVMTTPRLRHSPSLNFEASSSKFSSLGRRMPSELAMRDPFARLGLRVSMPNYVPRSGGAAQQPQPRSRTLSTMYMLGFGARELTGTLGSTAGPNRKKDDDILLKAEADLGREESSDVE